MIKKTKNINNVDKTFDDVDKKNESDFLNF